MVAYLTDGREIIVPTDLPDKQPDSTSCLQLGGMRRWERLKCIQRV